MKCYTYAELKENLLLTFERHLSQRDNSYIEAVSYSLIVYEADLGYGLEEQILIPLLIGKIMTERTNRLFVGQKKMFENAAKQALAKQNELDLTQEERSEVVNWAYGLLEKLPNVEVENDPRAK